MVCNNCFSIRWTAQRYHVINRSMSAIVHCERLSEVLIAALSMTLSCQSCQLRLPSIKMRCSIRTVKEQHHSVTRWCHTSSTLISYCQQKYITPNNAHSISWNTHTYLNFIYHLKHQLFSDYSSSNLLALWGLSPTSTLIIRSLSVQVKAFHTPLSLIPTHACNFIS